MGISPGSILFFFPLTSILLSLRIVFFIFCWCRIFPQHACFDVSLSFGMNSLFPTFENVSFCTRFETNAVFYPIKEFALSVCQTFCHLSNRLLYPCHCLSVSMKVSCMCVCVFFSLPDQFRILFSTLTLVLLAIACFDVLCTCNFPFDINKKMSFHSYRCEHEPTMHQI